MEFRTFQKQWGAEFISDDVVRFRVWAEGQKELTLRLAAADVPMTAAGDGWFQADVSGVTHGAEYQFVLQDGMTVPDPASRAQKGDVNGPSIVIDPQRYQPVNRDWAGRPWEDTVIYELHIGTSVTARRSVSAFCPSAQTRKRTTSSEINSAPHCF